MITISGPGLRPKSEEGEIVEGVEAEPVAQAPDVLVQHLVDDESVFLNLATEEYYGLDAVGTQMWSALVETGRTDLAFDRLIATFDIDAETLNRDLEEFVQRLTERGLLLVGDDAVDATSPSDAV